jgi:hypothetical protein
MSNIMQNTTGGFYSRTVIIDTVSSIVDLKPWAWHLTTRSASAWSTSKMLKSHSVANVTNRYHAANVGKGGKGGNWGKEGKPPKCGKGRSAASYVIGRSPGLILVEAARGLNAGATGRRGSAGVDSISVLSNFP